MVVKPALIVHVIHRLEAGGLQNGVVNLINNLPADDYRHAIVCLEDATDFRHRLRAGIEVIELRKRPGKDLPAYWRLRGLFQALRPSLVHTRNHGTLDTQLLAAMCGVPGRIHGEHGLDVLDIDGTRWKYNVVRRGVRPFVQEYIAVSADLAAWLVSTVGVAPERVHYIPNGVDAVRFSPGCRPDIVPDSLRRGGRLLIGTVGRMAEIKNQPVMVDAFVQLIARRPDLRSRIGLVLVGEGPLRAVCLQKLQAASSTDLAWVPGERNDIPDVMRALDVFVLPSRSEGMSNTILEAMAAGLPVIATDVGGNRQLVQPSRTGLVVPPDDAEELSRAMEYYSDQPEAGKAHGRAGRASVEQSFSLAAMVRAYSALYDSVLSRRRPS